MPSYHAFRQIKIRHIFIMQFGGYFVKFYSRQIFRPYSISLDSESHEEQNGAYVLFLRATIEKLWMIFSRNGSEKHKGSLYLRAILMTAALSELSNNATTLIRI